MTFLVIKDALIQGADRFVNGCVKGADYLKIHKVSSSSFIAAATLFCYGWRLKGKYTNARDLTQKIPEIETQLKGWTAGKLSDKINVNNGHISDGQAVTLEDLKDFLTKSENFDKLDKQIVPEILKARDEALKKVNEYLHSFKTFEIGELMLKIIDQVLDVLDNVKGKELEDCARTLKYFLKYELYFQATQIEEDLIGTLADVLPIQVALKVIVDTQNANNGLDQVPNRNYAKRKHLQDAINKLQAEQSIKDALSKKDEGNIASLMQSLNEKTESAKTLNNNPSQTGTDQNKLLTEIYTLAKTAYTANKGNSLSPLNEKQKELETLLERQNSDMGNVTYIYALAFLIFSGGCFTLCGNHIPALRKVFPSITQVG